MNTLSATTSLLTHAFAWALLHSLWQGLLVYGFLFILLKVFPNINARIKYYLSFSALTVIALWLADTWLAQYERLQGTIVYISAMGTDAAITTTYTAKASPAMFDQAGLAESLLNRLEHYFPFIVILYTIGLAFMLFRFLINILQLRGLRTQGLIPLAQKYYDMLAACQSQFGITKPVQLFLSNRISVPMMLGTLKPIILLPLATINHLTTEQVEAILLHELAHIKRHDYLLNIFQTIIETLLFFNPFVWLTSSLIRREREHCCDDLVVAGSATPLPYAKALAILEDHRLNNNGFALAATGSNNHLFNRIKRIMEMKKRTTNYNQLTVIIVALIAITFTIAMFTFTPSFAQKTKSEKKETSADTTAQKSVYKYKTVTIDANGKKTVVEKVSPTPLAEEEENNDGEGRTETKVYPNGTRVYKRIIRDQSGKENVLEEHRSGPDDDQVTVELDSKQMAKDMAQMGKDLKQMTKDLTEASIELSSVDWNKILDEISNGLKEVDKELNNPKLRKEIKIEMENSKAALEDAKRHMEASRKKHIVITENKAGEHGGDNFDGMLELMGKDGLIDLKGKYAISKKNDELYINGEKQSDAVYKKYSDYLKDRMIAIRGHNGSVEVVVND